MDPLNTQIAWKDSYGLYERERLEAPDPERCMLERESFEIVEIVILRFYRKYCPGRGALIVLILRLLVVHGLGFARIAELTGLERDCVLRLAEEGEEIVRDDREREKLSGANGSARQHSLIH
jgi:hypothetical protein